MIGKRFSLRAIKNMSQWAHIRRAYFLASGMYTIAYNVILSSKPGSFSVSEHIFATNTF